MMKTAPPEAPPEGCRPLASRREGRVHGVKVISLPSIRKGGPKITHHLSQGMERWNTMAKYAVVAMATCWSWGVLTGQPPAMDPNRIKTIVIDAGHGGKDPGALGSGRYKAAEKDIALNVSLLAGKYIKEAFPDVKVIYTREDDRFIELMERSMIANRAKADLFISVHCNANEKKDPIGSETYVMGLHKTEANMKVAMKENAAILLEENHEIRYDGFNPKDPESIIALSLRQNVHLDHSLLFSSLLQKQFRDRVGRQDRGVKQAGFLVISYTTMPSVLVELGFLSNPVEEDFLQSTQGQDYLASAIYRAFKDYKSMMEGVDTTPVVQEKPVVQETVSVADVPVVIASGVRFKVQVATSSKRIEPLAKNFNGMEGVEEHQGAGLFKYTLGNEPTLEEAREMQKRCRDKGFEGAFIVAFLNGERIELQEAVKLAQGH
jgi:N-acetylmuramoyl-L-alanine amidase